MARYPELLHTVLDTTRPRELAEAYRRIRPAIRSASSSRGHTPEPYFQRKCTKMRPELSESFSTLW